jgi:hypothetical protein
MVLGVCVALFASIAWIIASSTKAWSESLANRAAAKQEKAYEALADKAVYTQQKLLEQQDRLMEEVQDVKKRVLGIEKKLAEVD